MTVSSSRYEKKQAGESFADEAGEVAQAVARRAGHEVTKRTLISDDATMLRREVREFLAARDDVLLMTGGTGVSSRDITIETVRPYFEKELPGFGELFWRVSLDEVGSAAILTRATAGVA